METKVVDKRNLRNLLDMSHQRWCNRANWEYRNIL
ncbi:MAG: FAD-dependent thymidylate synthase [Eubacteriales bacterium]|nr:FAD-dependent thymidylate synthase [Eubacteriales bacterium]